MEKKTLSDKESKKALIASLIGSSIEWFDFILYSTAAAIVFNKLFFPNEDPAVSLLLSYATFGIPFFFRPFGGILFSHIGDKIGRKRTLVLTLSLMGISTVFIGLLPDYNTIGILAPILLTILRIIQGIGIGGEWGGALLLAVEYSDNKQRGLYGSVPQMGVTIGLILGTFSMSIMSLLPDDQFLRWGWRIPFILSAILVFIGLWIRNSLDETPALKEAQEKGNIAKVPLLETLRTHWKAVLVALGAKVVETAPFYIFSTFVVSYASSTLGYSKTTALNAVMVAAIVATILIPYMGKLSYLFGRKPLYIWGTVAIILFSFPYFFLLSTQSAWALVLASVIGLGVLWSPVTAVLGTLTSEIFSTNVRYTGVTLGYQLGAALAGGTAPFIATAFMNTYDNSWIPVAISMIITGLISIISVSIVKETRGIHL